LLVIGHVADWIVSHGGWPSLGKEKPR